MELTVVPGSPFLLRTSEPIWNGSHHRPLTKAVTLCSWLRRNPVYVQFASTEHVPSGAYFVQGLGYSGAGKRNLAQFPPASLVSPSEGDQVQTQTTMNRSSMCRTSQGKHICGVPGAVLSSYCASVGLLYVTPQGEGTVNFICEVGKRRQGDQ